MANERVPPLDPFLSNSISYGKWKSPSLGPLPTKWPQFLLMIFCEENTLYCNDVNKILYNSYCLNSGNIKILQHHFLEWGSLSERKIKQEGCDEPRACQLVVASISVFVSSVMTYVPKTGSERRSFS